MISDVLAASVWGLVLGTTVESMSLDEAGVSIGSAKLEVADGIFSS